MTEQYPDIVGRADAWLKYFRAKTDSGDVQLRHDNGEEVSWALEAVDLTIRSDAESCWSMILELVARCESDMDRANVAAGPLEDALVRFGQALIGRVEAEARSNEVFKNTLRGVWRNSIEDSVWNRLQELLAPN
jgi:hypothetical protein